MKQYAICCRQYTPEFVEELQKLGYNTGSVYGKECVVTCIFPNDENQYCIIDNDMFDDWNPRASWKANRIDCKDNTELALALAGADNELFEGQYFVCISTIDDYIESIDSYFEYVHKGDVLKYEDIMRLGNGMHDVLFQYFRRANAFDLIAHFNK